MPVHYNWKIDIMAQEKPPTPERQLLNLIEGSLAKANVQVEAIKHRSLSFFSFGAWLGRAAFYKQGFAHWLSAGDFRRLDIKSVNKLLGFFLFILSAYFIGSLFISLVKYNKLPEMEIKYNGILKPSPKKEAELSKVVSYYLEKVRARDIFKMGEKKTGGTTVEKVPSSRITELAQNLKLVGISWSNDPDVMLEDTKAQRTYFLKKGQMLENLNLKLEAVFKDKIILSCEGQEIELR